MFTGLVESLGKIQLLDQDHLKITMEGKGGIKLSDLALGDSVAVDGICLTVEKILTDGFIATVSPETIKRSILGYTEKTAQYSNLETSLRMGGKLGGHFVTGHVDGVGCLATLNNTANAWSMTFTSPESIRETWMSAIAPYLVLKGSIAVNGISLTIADCDSEGSWFTVAVIPHTYQETNLCYLGAGNWVNIESDILGKYVHRLLNHRLTTANGVKDIDTSFLAEHGYLS